ncbi:hypothetical protein VMCG_09300 [Cytospora schulzeri]|uniref:Extracellular membrane protein CFEM domain-containing protein n=1 Tax=Cytospora schulzeri TaxID=448051 RepID=A0A423VMG1_9PEZI|nr:hypothetical protein VMCG_09300 [Valsa malicola]
MKSFIVAASLSAVSYAQLDVALATDCSGLTNQCLGLPDVDDSRCNAGQAQCDQCQSDHAICQAPETDFSISQDACDDQLIFCVSSSFPQLRESESPAPTVTTTTTAPLATDSMTSDQCQTVYYQCLLGGKKQELCVCDLSTCKGEDTARSRASCSSMSVAATATSTPTCFYGWTQETASSEASPVDAERKSTNFKTNIVTGGVASSSVSLIGLAAALIAPLIV